MIKWSVFNYKFEPTTYKTYKSLLSLKLTFVQIFYLKYQKIVQKAKSLLNIKLQCKLLKQIFARKIFWFFNNAENIRNCTLSSFVTYNN